jgi:hypothetical protein
MTHKKSVIGIGAINRRLVIRHSLLSTVLTHAFLDIFELCWRRESRVPVKRKSLTDRKRKDLTRSVPIYRNNLTLLRLW